jgi:GntR family transcriptional regulator/MocR family aminotransferase
MTSRPKHDLALSIDPSRDVALYRQIYEELRAAILSGRLRPGEVVPSTREIALSLSVSRTTAKLAYDLLLSEGYVEGQVGSGTRVCELLPEELARSKQSQSAPRTAHASLRPRLSASGRALVEMKSEPDHSGLLFRFHYCRPDVERFPHTQWRRLQLEGLSGGDADLFNYQQDGMGYRPLRMALAKYLGHSRAVRCDADQIVIVNGTQQALVLLATVLLEPGDHVALENPGYSGALDLARQYRARVSPLPVGREGILIEKLPAKGARLLYVTPSHQFPTGVVLPLARRLELLRWAAATQTLIVEDDYDSEFRFGSRPVPALQGLDDVGCVAYIGTFSKTMFPSLRIGYLVLPRPLVTAVERAKWMLDRHTSLLDQHALAAFLTSGLHERHLRRMRKIYARRRTVMLEALRAVFGARVEVLGDPAGLHLMIRMKTRLTDAEVVARAAAEGVGIISASIYYAGKAPGGEFVLGYGQVSDHAITEGVRRLALAIR